MAWVRKLWRQLRREGIGIACCTTARLMKQMGLAGTIRGKPVKTTISNPAAPCPRDKVSWTSFGKSGEFPMSYEELEDAAVPALAARSQPRNTRPSIAVSGPSLPACVRARLRHSSDG
jgi:transposase InsO family protein